MYPGQTTCLETPCAHYSLFGILYGTAGQSRDFRADRGRVEDGICKGLNIQGGVLVLKTGRSCFCCTLEVHKGLRPVEPQWKHFLCKGRSPQYFAWLYRQRPRSFHDSGLRLDETKATLVNNLFKSASPDSIISASPKVFWRLPADSVAMLNRWT